jgi:hypothetical protein
VIAALFLTLLEIYGKEFNKQLTLVHKHSDPLQTQLPLSK